MTRFNRAKLRAGWRLYMGGLVLIYVGLLSGCGASWQTVARTSIEASAVTVDTLDTDLTAAIHRDCHHDGLDACLEAHGYDKAVTAIGVADAALRSAQAVVDAADRAGRERDWLAAAPCLGLAVRGVLDALTAAGVTVPPEVSMGLAAIEAFAGTCAARNIPAPTAP